MFHLIAQEQFAGIRDRLAAWNKTQISVQSVLNNRVFVDFTAQIIGKSGAGRRAERLMQSGSAQIGINQKYAAIWLTNDGLSKIRCHKGFAFRRDAAGNEQFL